MKVHKTDMGKIQEFAKSYRENKENFNQSRGAGSDLPWYDWKDKNLLRLLPPWSAEGLLALPIFTHYRLQPSGKNCQCLRRTWGMQCYVCTAYGRIWKSNSDIQWKWRNRAYANGVDRFAMDAGVQIIGLPIGVHNWVLIQMAPDPDEIAAGIEPIGDIADPQKGSDIRIIRTKTGPEDFNVDYSSTFINQGKPLHNDGAVAGKLLEGTFDLNNIFKRPGQKKIEENIAFARALLHDLGLDAAIGPGQLLDDDKYLVDSNGAERAAPSPIPTGRMQDTAATSTIDTGNKPDCYGEYKEGEEKCLICSFETDCMDEKGGPIEGDDDIPF